MICMQTDLKCGMNFDSEVLNDFEFTVRKTDIKNATRCVNSDWTSIDCTNRRSSEKAEDECCQLQMRCLQRAWLQTARQRSGIKKGLNYLHCESQCGVSRLAETGRLSPNTPAVLRINSLWCCDDRQVLYLQFLTLSVTCDLKGIFQCKFNPCSKSP